MNPLISVIIPVFNGEKWIEQTINSVLSQTFKSYELIIINDGSTDNTEKVILDFNDKLIYRIKENGGQASARNLGIKLASGEYISFIDSDDLWVPEKLDIQYSQLLQSGLKWSYTNAIAFREDISNIIFRFSESNKHYSGEIFDKLFLNCFIPSPTLLINKSVFDRIGLFNEDLLLKNREDWNMWIRISQFYPIHYISEPLAYYRLHSNSVTSSESRDNSINGFIYALRLSEKLDYERFGDLTNTRISDKYFLESRFMALGFNYIKAITYSFKAIKNNPSNLILYIYTLIILIYPINNFLSYKLRRKIKNIYIELIK
jgi:glycosyltransferase involved in cell wall biosynthesis